MKISILIPCYNSERWIGEAIESALNQTWNDKEIIVIDDGSKDSSRDVIRSFGERVRTEFRPNRGSNPTRNRLLELSEGPWIQYLDADDTLLPWKVEIQMQVASEETDVIYSPTQWASFDDNGLETRRYNAEIPLPHDPWELLIRWQLPQTGGALWKRSALVEVGGWNNQQPCCQEHELYYRLLAAGKNFTYHPGANAIYRQWSEETLCRRDPLKTTRFRMEVVDLCEAFLSEHLVLTPRIRNAIAETRYECARHLYSYDRSAANDLAQKARLRHPDFIFPDTSPFPRIYRTLFALLGFDATEKVAALVRSLGRKSIS